MRITKADIDRAKKPDFTGAKFPVKIRDVRKSKKRILLPLVVFGYGTKEKCPIYAPKICYQRKHVDLLLIGEEGIRYYLLTKDFNTFMYDHTHTIKKPIFVAIVYKLLVQKKY